MPTFDSVLVTGNQTINQDLQVDGNQTIQGNLSVNTNQTVQGSFLVNGSQTVIGNMAVASSLGVGSIANALFRLAVLSQSSTPIGGFSAQQVRFYGGTLAGQPGLVLKGTDGNNYVLFVDVSGGTPNLGIVRT